MADGSIAISLLKFVGEKHAVGPVSLKSGFSPSWLASFSSVALMIDVFCDSSMESKDR